MNSSRISVDVVSASQMVHVALVTVDVLILVEVLVIIVVFVMV